jgi:hypothetical protein
VCWRRTVWRWLGKCADRGKYFAKNKKKREKRVVFFFSKKSRDLAAASDQKKHDACASLLIGD